jgi:nicotinamide riboside kinase
MAPSKPKVLNLFAGPGAGKSTIAASLFSELKFRGVSTEYVQEFAKDVVWEKRGVKILQAQDYIFSKQHFRISRVADEVDIVITDSPILLSMAYCQPDYLPSLKSVIKEAYDLYDNMNFFIHRNKAYDTRGRMQTFDEAKEKDRQILNLLYENNISPFHIEYGRGNAETIIEIMQEQKWLPMEQL